MSASDNFHSNASIDHPFDCLKILFNATKELKVCLFAISSVFHVDVPQ